MHPCLLPSVVDHTSCNENVWIPQKSQQWSPFDNLGQNTHFTGTQVTWWILCGKIGLSILVLILKNSSLLLSMPFPLSYAIQNNIWRNLTGLLRTSSVKITFSTQELVKSYSEFCFELYCILTLKIIGWVSERHLGMESSALNICGVVERLSHFTSCCILDGLKMRKCKPVWTAKVLKTRLFYTITKSIRNNTSLFS